MRISWPAGPRQELLITHTHTHTEVLIAKSGGCSHSLIIHQKHRAPLLSGCKWNESNRFFPSSPSSSLHFFSLWKTVDTSEGLDSSSEGTPGIRHTSETERTRVLEWWRGDGEEITMLLLKTLNSAHRFNICEPASRNQLSPEGLKLKHGI